MATPSMLLRRLPQQLAQQSAAARTQPKRGLTTARRWTSEPARQHAPSHTPPPQQLARTPQALQNPRVLTAPSRSFSATTRRGRDHHFDTLKFVQRLQEEGFSEEQATAMMRVLADVMEESIQNLTRTMVPREEAERAQYTQKVDFTKLRSELLAADGAEAQVARQTHERLANELAKLGGRLRDEIGRTQASVRLDLNLEKGRVREEANTQDTKIKETDSRIDQELAGLHERIEGVKFDTLRWLLGFFTGMSALMLGAWRLLM